MTPNPAGGSRHDPAIQVFSRSIGDNFITVDPAEGDSAAGGYELELVAGYLPGPTD